MAEVFDKYSSFNNYIYKGEEAGRPTSKQHASFFENIADRIVADFNPKTVLDAGCGFGYLVVALRAKGVQAYGIGALSGAESEASQETLQFCRAGKISEPLPKGLPENFDLIVCAEVLQHIYSDEAAASIANLCSKADKILFSSFSHSEQNPGAAVVNVQQREYWAKLFFKYGFLNDVLYDAGYLNLHAMLFVKREISAERLVEDYERSIRMLFAQKDKQLEQCEQDLLLREDAYASLEHKTSSIEEKSRKQKNYNQVLRYYEIAFEAMQSSLSWRVTKPLRSLMGKIKGTTEDPFPTINLDIISDAQLNILPTRSPVLVAKYIERAYSALQQLDVLSVPEGSCYMNVVLDCLDKKDLFGGGVLALVLAGEYCIKNGMALRIITRKAPPNAVNYYEMMELCAATPPKEVVFYSDHDRGDSDPLENKLEVGSGDIFFVSSWDNAYSVSQTVGGGRFFYLVENDQPVLQSELERRCYQKLLRQPNIDFIFPTKGAGEQMRLALHDFSQNSFCIESFFPHLKVDKTLFDSFDNVGKKKLLVCVGGKDDDALLGYLLKVLDKCIAERTIDVLLWDIYLENKNGEEIIFTDLTMSKNTKNMGCKEYASLLEKTDFAISLDVGICAATAAYEVVVCGGVVVANKALNNDFITDKTVLSSMDSLADDIRRGMEIAMQEATSKKRRAATNDSYSKDTQLQQAVVFMEKKHNV